MTFLKVLRGIWIPGLTIPYNCQQVYHIKKQPLLEYCIEQKNGRICLGSTISLIAVSEVELGKINFSRPKNTLKHIDNIGKAQYY